MDFCQRALNGNGHLYPCVRLLKHLKYHIIGILSTKRARKRVPNFRKRALNESWIGKGGTAARSYNRYSIDENILCYAIFYVMIWHLGCIHHWMHERSPQKSPGFPKKSPGFPPKSPEWIIYRQGRCCSRIRHLGCIHHRMPWKMTFAIFHICHMLPYMQCEPKYGKYVCMRMYFIFQMWNMANVIQGGEDAWDPVSL